MDRPDLMAALAALEGMERIDGPAHLCLYERVGYEMDIAFGKDKLDQERMHFLAFKGDIVYHADEIRSRMDVKTRGLNTWEWRKDVTRSSKERTKQFQAEYKFEGGRFRRVSSSSVDTAAGQQAIQATVEAAGWRFKDVSMRKLRKLVEA